MVKHRPGSMVWIEGSWLFAEGFNDCRQESMVSGRKWIKYSRFNERLPVLAIPAMNYKFF